MNWTNYNFNTTSSFSLNGLQTYGRVVQIHDGDSMTVILPLHDKFYKFSIRLARIDTCEVTSKISLNKTLAINAKKRLIELVTSSTNDIPNIKKYLLNNIALVYIKCFDFDKYGRILASVYKDKDDPLSFSEILVKEKLAYQYDGKKKLTEEEQSTLLSS